MCILYFAVWQDGKTWKTVEKHLACSGEQKSRTRVLGFRQQSRVPVFKSKIMMPRSAVQMHSIHVSRHFPKALSYRILLSPILAPRTVFQPPKHNELRYRLICGAMADPIKNPIKVSGCGVC